MGRGSGAAGQHARCTPYSNAAFIPRPTVRTGTWGANGLLGCAGNPPVGGAVNHGFVIGCNSA
jgi:hypothetical protein